VICSPCCPPRLSIHRQNGSKINWFWYENPVGQQWTQFAAFASRLPLRWIGRKPKKPGSSGQARGRQEKVALAHHPTALADCARRGINVG
jgi:hypothetical protein